ncbi:MAG: 3-hydroxybutyryl-CoA dehydrogenase [Candidatus Eisenbacteria bacterium]|nr:3-hydroxybutyryl-CoA dehydrogenase [Candidatus Eisenbacteria bacterium]
MAGLEARDGLLGVVGAGTMGAGIAQVAAGARWHVVLVDARPGAAEAAVGRVAAALARLVEKGRLIPAQRDERLSRLRPARGLGELAPAALVIEAIHEDLSAKRAVVAELGALLSDPAVIATNTSSLSVTAIAAAARLPARALGIHFFNPAPLMEVVEVVPALQTEPGVVQECVELLRAWGKDPVVVRDTPGFLVNRVARPFYGEALRLVEEGLATPEEVDAAMKTEAGFRMGPFELMDLIGNDVNFAVTESIFRGTGFDRRYLPSALQQRHVEAGYLGRKCGRGFYTYPPGPVAPVRVDPERARWIARRVLALLINEAAEALRTRLALADDIERAMTGASHYPKGLLHWADELGASEVVVTLEELFGTYGDMRYRPSPLLSSMARKGTKFFPADVPGAREGARAARPAARTAKP